MLVPSPLKQLSAWKGHPYFHPGIVLGELTVTVDGIPVERCVVADCINGYVKVLFKDHTGNYPLEKRGRGLIPKLRRIKGHVIIMEKRNVNRRTETP